MIHESFTYNGKVVSIHEVGPIGLQERPSYIAYIGTEPFKGHRWYKSVEGIKRAVRKYIRELQYVERSR